MAGSNGNGNGNGSAVVGTSTVKQGLAQMLKGGVIVSCLVQDVTRTPSDRYLGSNF